MNNENYAKRILNMSNAIMNVENPEYRKADFTKEFPELIQSPKDEPEQEEEL